MARLPNPQLAQQWRERLERFDRSELTIAEFCELEGYSIASFCQWRRKLVSVRRGCELETKDDVRAILHSATSAASADTNGG